MSITNLDGYCKAIEDGEVIPIEVHCGDGSATLLPTPTKPFLFPNEFAEYERVLATPGAHTGVIAHSGMYYEFALLNSARYSRHVTICYNYNDKSLSCYFSTITASLEYRY